MSNNYGLKQASGITGLAKMSLQCSSKRSFSNIMESQGSYCDVRVSTCFIHLGGGSQVSDLINKIHERFALCICSFLRCRNFIWEFHFKVIFNFLDELVFFFL